ncbi:MAG: class I SAM-dependent methyltransferase [Bacteroidota bacterium]
MSTFAAVQKLYMIRQFFRFYWKATTLYQIHSPFVYELAQHILEDQRWFYTFSQLRETRQRMRQDPRRLEVTDYGAGSKLLKNKSRAVAAIARTSLSPPRTLHLLFRLINHLKPQKLLELGTSLGLSAFTQSQASLNGQLITLEGCPEIAKIARENFQRLKAQNIQLLEGPFSQSLPKALSQLEQLDYVFIDGHHAYEPTIQYFKQCLQYAHNTSVFVFDDLYWSAEMTAAWEAIKAHPKVRLSIDLFFIGLVFFREEQKTKKHYRLVPIHWKPWIMGFFRS